MSDQSSNQKFVGGPFFDQLAVGQIFDTAPGVTLTSGLAAAHQAIVGDRMRLPLDHNLAGAVTGQSSALAHPGLVCDAAIGQSTLATHHVKANLYYRGLEFRAFPHLGDTLYTQAEVAALRDNSPRPDRRQTGLAAFRVTTTDQRGRTVLDFYRCAMIPFSPHPDPNRAPHTDDVSSIGPTDSPDYQVPRQWDLEVYRRRTGCRQHDAAAIGTVFLSSGDVVSSSPELARLTLNVAATHHDERVGATGRLVYGGHTIGIALGQATRALPNMVTVLGWTSCDHLGPVSEGDTLTSELRVERSETIGGETVLHLRSLVFSHNEAASDTPVLDWKFAALVA